ncbi:MAG: Leucine--tRNA ligase [bacterium ADurb.Bin429]|nr:MAG: Leucine--tRNA ligase [bacterium ADurb.Bin429]
MREMSERYQPGEIEPEWQRRWSEAKLHESRELRDRPKFYFLDMFAYPSGDLHWGHLRNYTIGDVVSRYQMHRGFNVMHPTGFDAFGLPAENAAIKRGIHPREWTYKNIANMESQFRAMGYSYDWSREVITCDPAYYRWNQWFFIQFYKAGLAYKKKSPVNWCPECQTALANEQVVNAACERCGTAVVKRMMEQWYFRITDYADRLLEGHAKLDWPEDVILMQRNWIGKSQGVEFDWQIDGLSDTLRVFTTRPDTVFGVTYMVLAPEHPLVDVLTTADHRAEVETLRQVVAGMSEIDRTSTEQEKLGAFTGAYAINPMNCERVPVYIANYVMMEYGTGAIMAVPAHDQRDFEFARKYGLPVRIVIAPEGTDLNPDAMTEAFEAAGNMVNSGTFTDLPSEEGWVKIAANMETRGIGKRTINYRLRDWCISRQRYWGTPIPMVYCDTCGIQPVPEDQLPVLLPDDVKFSGAGESPLTTSPTFMQTTCPQCGGPARRDADTMDTFMDSSWYFLRYCSPHENQAAFDPETVRYWMPVDQYIGGREHATMHLIYARFFTMALHDLGLVDFNEPFLRLFNQGIVTAGGKKMSKRSGAVPPNDVVHKYGADAARLFILFMAPAGERAEWGTDPETSKPYSVPPGIEGIDRFLNRLWRHVYANRQAFTAAWASGEMPASARNLRRKTHQTIDRVTADIERFQFNTAISAMMELLNEMYGYTGGGLHVSDGAWSEAIETLVRLLSPFAPHIACELWTQLGFATILPCAPWPAADPAVAAEDSLEIPIQVNGKMRDKLVVPVGTDNATLESLALASEAIRRTIGAGTVRKVIVVPGKLVNIVIG